jgi:hypothetical protein
MPIRRLIVLTALMLAAASSAPGQMYPRWFLYQGMIPQSRIGVGYVRPSMYRDSSTAYAFRAGCTSYAMDRRMSISGSEAFWSTEGGTAWMGSEIGMSYDTSAAEAAQRQFCVLDMYHDKVKTIVLSGDSGLVVSGELKTVISVASIRMPDWVEKLPSRPHTIFAVGQSEEYYYETSSWETAERVARIALGRQVKIGVSGLQKLTDIEGQDIRNSVFSTELHDVSVVARWRDLKKKIFYVLVSMPQ